MNTVLGFIKLFLSLPIEYITKYMALYSLNFKAIMLRNCRDVGCTQDILTNSPVLKLMGYNFIILMRKSITGYFEKYDSLEIHSFINLFP